MQETCLAIIIKNIPILLAETGVVVDGFVKWKMNDPEALTSHCPTSN